MAGLEETRTMDALLTTTLAYFQKTLVDQIFDDYPLLSYLNGKLGVALRGKTVKKVLSSGESIVEHLLYEQNSTVKSYAGAEQLDTTLQDGMTIARFSWKQYAASIGITGLDKRSNQGEAALISLLQSKTTQAQMSLRDTLSVDAYGDGTNNASKVLGGLENIVSTTTTCGSLPPGTFAWWKAVVNSGGSFASQGLNDMRTTYNDVSYGNDKPDSIFMPQAVFEYFEKSLQPQERYVNTRAANVGFDNLTFKGIPVLFDRDCTSGTIYFLNSNSINFVVHRDADFKTGAFQTPENQDVSTAMIIFQGNLTTGERRKLAKIMSITA